VLAAVLKKNETRFLVYGQNARNGTMMFPQDVEDFRFDHEQVVGAGRSSGVASRVKSAKGLVFGDDARAIL
jgi:hypothetical protein